MGHWKCAQAREQAASASEDIEEEDMPSSANFAARAASQTNTGVCYEKQLWCPCNIHSQLRFSNKPMKTSCTDAETVSKEVRFTRNKIMKKLVATFAFAESAPWGNLCFSS